MNVLRSLAVALTCCLVPAQTVFAQADEGRMAAGCMSIYTTQRGLLDGAARDAAETRLAQTLRRLQAAAPDARDGQALVKAEATVLRQRLTQADDRQALFDRLKRACDAWLGG